MIATGRQIAAARALLGWSQEDLADAAGLHVNSVAYWERHEAIPSYRAPVACERIANALLDAGAETFLKPSPGVRLITQPRCSANRSKHSHEESATT
jgi:transcriptional regulator with XRE-family HTH domain